MTGAEALVYFTLQVGLASSEVRIPAPLVRAVSSAEQDPRASLNVLAYVEPNRVPASVAILWRALWGEDKRTLRCIARHEVAHVVLAHEPPRDGARAAFQHVQVDVLLRQQWGEPGDCGLMKARRSR